MTESHDSSPAAKSAPRVALGIETATPLTGVGMAWMNGDREAFAFDATGDSPVRPASERLLGAIDAVLREHALDRSRIVAVGVTHGPGMFTSLRVGLTIAKTLAHGLRVPIYVYSSLEAWAATADRTGVVCSLLDARRGEFYTGVYRVSAAGATTMRPSPLREDRVEPLANAIASLRGLSGDEEPIVFAGAGVAVARATLEEAFGPRMWVAPADRSPAAWVARHAATDFNEAVPSSDPLAVSPVYLRPSDAEKRHRIDVGIQWSAP